jgi:Zinc finger, C3HC4 type (RING finger)
MSHCGFCGISGHNIRSCNNELVGLLLLRMRCKTEKSSRINNWHILHNWIYNRSLKELRMLLANKYRVKITGTKRSLVDLLFELESCEYTGNNGGPIENPYEKELLIYNILNIHNTIGDYNTLEPFDIETLFTVFLACLEQNKESAKYNIIVSECEFEEAVECSICYEMPEKTNMSRYNCGHEFCGECTIQHIKSKKSHPECALCRGPIKSIQCSSEKITQFREIII